MRCPAVSPRQATSVPERWFSSARRSLGRAVKPGTRRSSWLAATCTFPGPRYGVIITRSNSGPFGTIRLRMELPAEKRDLGLMRRMFSTIAPRYDFITRAFSYGMDGRWKKMGVERARLPQRPVILDLASGTGDFSALVEAQRSEARREGEDLTERMLQLARARGVEHAVCADAGRLPFADGAFD